MTSNNLISIIIFSASFLSCNFVAAEQSVADENIELGTDMAVQEIDVQHKSVREWAKAVRADTPTQLVQGSVLGEVSRYVNDQATALNCLRGFENIAKAAQNIKDPDIRNTILDNVVRQYLMLSIKLRDRIAGHAKLRTIYPELKPLFDGADKQCEAMIEFHNSRIKVLVKSPGLKQHLSEPVVLELTKIGIKL